MVYAELSSETAEVLKIWGAGGQAVIHRRFFDETVFAIFLLKSGGWRGGNCPLDPLVPPALEIIRQRFSSIRVVLPVGGVVSKLHNPSYHKRLIMTRCFSVVLNRNSYCIYFYSELLGRVDAIKTASYFSVTSYVNSIMFKY